MLQSEQGSHKTYVPAHPIYATQVFDFWPQSLASVARKHRSALGLLVGRWGTPAPRPVPLYMVRLVLQVQMQVVFQGKWHFGVRVPGCRAYVGDLVV